MEQIKHLNYGYADLEPFIDEQTMKIHHDKHHQAYFDKFNNAIKETYLKDKSIKEILADLEKIPQDIKTLVINNGGGYFHHTFFWSILKKEVLFNGEVADAILYKWETFDKFKEEFSSKALSLFGSGWTWLVLNNNELEIINTLNQDSPISQGMIPLLALDVWEHAYYLKYQNKRAEYVENFWNVINWEQVEKYYLAGKQ